MLRIKHLTIEQIVIILFSILPVIDSINGILITNGFPSIGIVYKVFVLGVMLLFLLRTGKANSPALLISLVSILYIVVSVCVNLVVFSGELIDLDYPVKLIFNLLTFALLFSLWHVGCISSSSIDTIFRINTVLIIAVILIPYVLGLGNTIYSGGIGYKGFFYSNNELSVVLLILFYYCLFLLARRLSILNAALLLGITVCVLLLNTKSGMAACLLGGVLFVFEYLCKRDSKYKLPIIILICAALFMAKDFILEQIAGFMTRQSYLYSLYGGSMLDTILSGRTDHVVAAWNALSSDPLFLLRFLIGNGFCSVTLVEMDFIDIFFYLGILGVSGLSAFLVWLFAASLRNFKHDKTLMRPFGFLMSIGFSFLAGHTLFMATSGCYFVLFLLFCLVYLPDSVANSPAK